MKSKRAITKCAKWLAYCLEIGWDKKDLPELEKLWWKHRSKDTGELKKSK
jgi:hypothetical protein